MLIPNRYSFAKQTGFFFSLFLVYFILFYFLSKHSSTSIVSPFKSLTQMIIEQRKQKKTEWRTSVTFFKIKLITFRYYGNSICFSHQNPQILRGTHPLVSNSHDMFMSKGGKNTEDGWVLGKDGKSLAGRFSSVKWAIPAPTPNQEAQLRQIWTTQWRRGS